MSDDNIVNVPAPGTLGIGVGRLLEPIPERGEDPAGHFQSVVWFPYEARQDAEEFAAASGWVLREGVAL